MCSRDRVPQHRAPVGGIDVEVHGAYDPLLKEDRKRRKRLPRLRHVAFDKGLGVRSRERLRDVRQEPGEFRVIPVRERIVNIGRAERTQNQSFSPNLDLASHGRDPNFPAHDPVHRN